MNQKSRLTMATEIAGIIGVILAYLAFANQIGFWPFDTKTTSAPSLSASAPTSTAVPTPTLAPTPTATPIPEPTSTPRPAATITPKPTDTPLPTATLTPKPTDTPRPTATPTPGIGSIQVTPLDGATMVFVPAGEFTMGSNDNDDEKPAHQVSLDAFWMDKHEVANALYKKCVDAGKCTAPSEKKSFTHEAYYGDARYNNYPVIYVSWNDANAYCSWAGKRLPTEAEWEKAARGPSSANDRRIFPWGNTFDANLVNSSEGFRGDTVAVDSFPNGASGYGVLNLAGNVWEWVADWYDPNYYANAPRNNPKGPSAGQQRVLRGGAWFFNQLSVRTSLRYSYLPGAGSYLVGFRCVQ